MEQAQERWLWVMKRREVNLDTKVNYTVYGGAWEEDQAGFAEDHHAERMNIHLWPPRCYSCSFCKREFKSAQALGGHMNVHRRDRARLKQTIHHHDKSSSDHNHVHDQHDSSSPNTDIDASKVSALWSSSPSSSLMGKRSSSSVCHDVHDHVHHVETSLSVGLNRDQGNEFCKRSKITTTTSSSSVSTRPPVARGGCLLMSSSSSSSNDKCGLIRASSNVNKETNLDLELRLGDAPKVK